MKKILLLALSACMLFILFTFGASADDKMTAFELLGKWEMEGYPEDIGGIYPTVSEYDTVIDEETTCFDIFIVNLTDARTAEISAMLSDGENVTFKNAKYSFNRLMEINNEIAGKYPDELSYVEISPKGDLVVAYTTDGNIDEFREKLINEYGDVVAVEADERVYILSPEIGNITESTTAGGSDNNRYSIIISVIAVLLIGAVVFAVSMKKKTGAVLSDGSVVSTDTKLSDAEIESAVSSSSLTPDDRVYNAVRDEFLKK